MSTADRVYEEPEAKLDEGEVFEDPFKDEDVVDEVDDTVEDTDDPTQDESPEPEKFRGKSREDIIESYMNAERELGRKNSEVGELRKLADDFIRQQLNVDNSTTSKAVKKKEVDVDYLLEDPSHAIEELVNDNPRLKALEEELNKAKIEKSKAAFQGKHNDWQETLASQDFQEWVTASPVRQKMLMEADKNYDYYLADDLFSTYKDLRGAKVDEVKAKAAAKRKSDMKKAGGERSTSGETAKKVYRRKDLIRLKIEDRARYDAMAEDIYLAYQEGRVR